jgi:hypothetical protein
MCPDKLAFIKAKPVAIIVPKDGEMQMGYPTTPKEFSSFTSKENVRKLSFKVST